MQCTSSLLKPLLLIVLCLRLAATQHIHPRSSWTKRPLRGVPRLREPVQYVIIHHTVTAQCSSPPQCQQLLRNIQADHLRRRFPNVGYNFFIASDGSVYEGVGYGWSGSHAPGYNQRSYGIAFIGNFDSTQPSTRMLQAATQLLLVMARTGRLQPNYKILGHRQTKATSCPGNRLFAEIQKWPRWSATP